MAGQTKENADLAAAPVHASENATKNNYTKRSVPFRHLNPNAPERTLQRPRCPVEHSLTFLSLQTRFGPWL